MIFDFFRRPATRSEVTMPLHEWHAWSIAMDGLVEHNDELQERIDQHEGILERCGKQIARLTEERDRARRWAVALEQDVADLERVNAELRQQLASAEVHGVPA